ncbi:DUF2333 family protein (plasmid) [Vibrio parahaemolyticus]|uniref:DUF2333 family protein n=3 Tax=Vibrio TaxID=662 RepID=A0AAX0M675_VIBPH|nr:MULTISPECIES: DUF2333 family protein [Vibrio]EJG0766571.1 DUF2333 family protein [Vibrio parahaemolyticus O5:K30]MCS0327158.1 DUF2333 family protein [Vibrio diabolicus]ARN70074.1 hypothetical protein FORC36_5557 [Vibrio vulnificus]AXX63274.1 hypothetical protein FORC53_4935 [Vibrio vulnificus]EGQ8302532.1 DUF2333 family protein [Vibrio parahaemolyticus]
MTQPKKSYKSKLILSAIAASVIAVTGYVHVISNTPDIKQTKEILKIQQIKNSDQVVGDAFTATNIQLIETLLNKTGGFTSNDLLVKAKVFDNMPNWEEGVIGMVKDSVLTLEKEFSRSQSQDLKDKKLSEAFSSISYSPTSWWFPSSEDQYKKASNALGDYLSRISDPKDKNAQFYARADNLRAWLDLVSNSLGSYSQRLSASVEQERFNTDLSNDKAAVQSTYSDQKVVAKTPWLEIDDVYWEARGASWALIQLLYAVEDDFGTVLKDKNAVASLKQIIRDLEDTQKTRYWPVVLNGSPFGVTANHSLGMANYISRANNGIIELIRLLERG